MESHYATEIIQQMFEASCIELFTFKGLHIVPTDCEGFDGSVMPTSIIDGGSRDYELSLGLRLPYTLLELTYPTQDGNTIIDEQYLEDWLNELGNLLLGVLKAKLIEHDSTLQMGLPNYYYGSDADPILDEYNRHTVYFECEKEVIEMSIGIEMLNNTIELAVIAQQGKQPGAMGELEFF